MLHIGPAALKPPDGAGSAPPGGGDSEARVTDQKLGDKELSVI